MQNSPHDETSSTPPADQADQDRVDALALDVSFNGQQFRYREFKYDKLADAMVYARLDRSRDGYRPIPVVDAEWLPRPELSDADRALMERFAITFEDSSFRYQGHRYTRLADALNQAQRPK